eukprot:c14063_g1_i2 orf=622-888(-)
MCGFPGHCSMGQKFDIDVAEFVHEPLTLAPHEAVLSTGSPVYSVGSDPDLLAPSDDKKNASTFSASCTITSGVWLVMLAGAALLWLIS